MSIVFRAIFSKIKQGLTKTRNVFGNVTSLFRLKGRVDKAFLEKLDERLDLADVGPTATLEISERVRQAFLDKEISGDVEAFVKKQLRELLTAPQEGLHYSPDGPTVVMIAGINGSGKTTSIAKLARRCQEEGKKVMVAACDTFRAAAVEQLTIWSQRLGCEIVKSQQGSDPASVAHDACEKAKSRHFDVLIDATAGQNALTQAEMFKKTVKCTGVILAKLDGTAKGGAIFGVKQKVGLPVKFIGVGEKL